MINPIQIQFVLRVCALILILFALARPQDIFRSLERSVSGIDIVLLMDLSLSMNIEDLAERPRIDIAKETIEKFIRGRSNDRLGFVVFSGEAVTLVPPTLDYGLMLQSVEQVEVGSLKDGTAIGNGLALAVTRLKDSEVKSKVIILLTDGENNLGQIDPSTAGEMAQKFGIKVYTIAIGREGRVRLPIKHQTPLGQVITTYQWFDNALNADLLKSIAEKTNGRFYRVTDEQALDNVFKEIDQLEKTQVKANERVQRVERYQAFLMLGILLLLIEKLLRFWPFRIAV